MATPHEDYKLELYSVSINDDVRRFFKYNKV